MAAGGDPVKGEAIAPPQQTEPEDIWERLLEGIQQVYHCNPAGMSRGRYMELYNCVFNYASSTSWNSIKANATTGTPPDQSLMLKLYARIENFLESYLESMSADGEYLTNEPFLRFYAYSWEKYKFSSAVLDGICTFLNRTCPRRMRPLKKKPCFDIYDLALILWNRVFIFQFKNQLINSVLRLMEKARSGEEIDATLVRVVLSSYVEVGVDNDDPADKKPGLKTYETVFHNSFLEASSCYYGRVITEYLDRYGASEYVKWVDVCLREEKRRVQLYMHESTLKPLLAICEKVLIADHLEVFYDEFKHLLKSDTQNRIGQLLKIVSHSKCGLEQLQVLFEEHVQADGQASLGSIADKALHNPTMYVCTLLEVHKKYSTLVSSEFINPAGFITSLDNACGKLVNSNAVTSLANSSAKSAELLARYCGDLLNKTTRNPHVQDIEDGLNDAAVLFKYLDDKDVFQKFYACMLAKRLVNQMSVSEDAERCMTSRLKQAGGLEYTSNLQRLLQDFSLSKSLNEEFKHFSKHCAGPIGLDFTAVVVTSCAWPFKEQATCNLPLTLLPCSQLFRAFYGGRYSSRTLTWLYNVSSGELATNCFKNPHALQASMFQMAVLLQYNSELSFNVQQLQENTGIAMDTLISVLRSLLKCRLLVHAEEGTEDTSSQAASQLQPGAVLYLNENYSNKRVHVNINVPMTAEVRVEQKTADKSARDDRKLCIQATIVRIMKARKTLKHKDLVAEVLSQLSPRFKPEVLAVKACIDILLDKEYIERAPEGVDVYNYVA